MRRVIIASLITTAALAAPGAAASAAPKARTGLADGTGTVFLVGGGLEDFGTVQLPAVIRRSTTTSWSYGANTTFAAGSGCTTTIGTCYTATGTLTLTDGAGTLTATIVGTDDATAAFGWTARVTSGTGTWRRARGTIRVTGTRDWANGQQTISAWDLTGITL